ncbi:hypothetical protein SprV_0401702200 [Sparganum proliferum]
MDVAQGTADEQESWESLGAFIALAVLLLIHVICWIISIVKAIRDRKIVKKRREDSVVKQKLLSADSEHQESEKDKSECSGVKFALSHSDDGGAAPAAISPPRAEPVKHHFARSPQRILSAGNAKRVTAEELAIMLDSYSVPSTTSAITVATTTISRPPPSPRPIPSPTVEIEAEPASSQALLA